MKNEFVKQSEKLVKNSLTQMHNMRNYNTNTEKRARECADLIALWRFPFTKKEIYSMQINNN